jgi:excisionase family DNA binding protein
VREIGATSPENAGVLAAGLAELLEQFAASTAARVAELVNEHRPAAEPRYYNVAEAAEYLRCCRGRIYNLSSQGRLKGRRDGGRLLFTRADLDALVEASP